MSRSGARPQASKDERRCPLCRRKLGRRNAPTRTALASHLRAVHADWLPNVRPWVAPFLRARREREAALVAAEDILAGNRQLDRFGGPARNIALKRAPHGAPLPVGARVVVVGADEPDMTDEFLGAVGRVAELHYRTGCSDAFPNDPMILVFLDDGRNYQFWHNELERLGRGRRARVKREEAIIASMAAQELEELP